MEILAGKAFQEEGRVGAKMEGQGWAGAFKATKYSAVAGVQ